VLWDDDGETVVATPADHPFVLQALAFATTVIERFCRRRPSAAASA
jgi:hypothetical protein